MGGMEPDTKQLVHSSAPGWLGQVPAAGTSLQMLRQKQGPAVGGGTRLLIHEPQMRTSVMGPVARQRKSSASHWFWGTYTSIPIGLVSGICSHLLVLLMLFCAWSGPLLAAAQARSINSNLMIFRGFEN